MVKLILYAALSLTVALLIIGTTLSAAGQAGDIEETVQNMENTGSNNFVTDGNAVSYDLPETNRAIIRW
jgi:hypothetical protein